jgi:ABC-type ATPase with predicted acetyltransferase domain
MKTRTWECDGCGEIIDSITEPINPEKDVRWCHDCLITHIKETLPLMELSDIAYELKLEIEKENAE